MALREDGKVTQAPLRDRLASTRWWHPGIPWALAGLGGLAMFGSLVSEWQVVRSPIDPLVSATEEYTVGVLLLFAWGSGWLVGGIALATCGWLALAGQPTAIRGFARGVGVALAGVLLGFLVAATIGIGQATIFAQPDDPRVETEIGRGLYAAYASVVLLGGAIFLSGDRRTRPSQLLAEPVEPPEDTPDDLAVGPAEPFVHVDDDQTLR